MTILSMRCAKCGLIQALAPVCKSCGARASGDAPQSASVAGRRGPPVSSVTLGAAAADDDWSSNRASDRPRRFDFRGKAGTLFGIYVVNILLTLCTLGVYSFWAKVKVRRFLLSQSEFEGDRFAYHGTARELLLGTLKAALVFGLPAMLLRYLPPFLHAPLWIQMTAGVLAYVIALVFIPFAVVGTRRYRLSRSSWRGIRFSFRGSVKEFVKLYVRGGVLTLLTLGLYSPFFTVRQYAFFTANSYFGNEKFQFEGSGRDLFRSYVIALLLTIPTLGLSGFWYAAHKHRYLIGRTSLGAARFDCDMTGGALCWLTLSNILILLGTLGLGAAVVAVRNLHFWFDKISLRGSLDLAAIEQDAQSASATAEGLAGFLDLDFNLAG